MELEVLGLSEAWNELDKVHSTFCMKLMCILNCPTNGFDDMTLGRERR
jgi:hypothetical protein